GKGRRLSAPSQRQPTQPAPKSSRSGRLAGHPFFTHAQSGHGRIEVRQLHAFAIEPLTADFPFARTLIVLRSERTVKKTGASTTESRYHLSSVLPQHYKPEQWLGLIRGHWGGVEIRNHWRRDALMGEDRSRSRQPQLLANLALIRNALLCALAEQLEDSSQPKIRECLHSNPSRCFTLINSL